MNGDTSINLPICIIINGRIDPPDGTITRFVFVDEEGYEFSGTFNIGGSVENPTITVANITYKEPQIYVEYDNNGNLIANNLRKLENGYYFFSLQDNLKSFKGDLSSLTNGNSMFRGCTNLTSFDADLSSLSETGAMFGDCKLDGASVRKILTTIPTYADDGSHSLYFSVSEEGK
jgi:hypothetical protein